MIVASITLLTGFSSVFAQEQEGKLIDRLLRPNMSLANPAQNKQFAAAEASIDKRVQTGTVDTSGKSLTKSFGDTRVLSPGEFAARHFRTGPSTANLPTRSQLPSTEPVHIVSATYGARVAPESVKNIATAPFADNRPFLGQGKSQKALHAHDQPLTIEQVRELLNKNK